LAEEPESIYSDVEDSDSMTVSFCIGLDVRQRRVGSGQIAWRRLDKGGRKGFVCRKNRAHSFHLPEKKCERRVLDRSTIDNPIRGSIEILIRIGMAQHWDCAKALDEIRDVLEKCIDSLGGKGEHAAARNNFPF
jgi:hypothetical protein